MDALVLPSSAARVAHSPAHRIPGGNRCDNFTWLERDVGQVLAASLRSKADWDVRRDRILKAIVELVQLYRLNDSGLVVGETLVTAEQLAALPVSGPNRRLLVLKVCSGATSLVRGGMARIGLSQELASPNQQVVAHLWPIGMYGGLAFGAQFALELTRGAIVDALAATIRAMRNPVELRAGLRAELGEDLEIHHRIEYQDDQIGNVLSWGAPVLLT